MNMPNGSITLKMNAITAAKAVQKSIFGIIFTVNTPPAPMDRRFLRVDGPIGRMKYRMSLMPISNT